MSESELISACYKNDKAARRQFYEMFYPELSVIALRYSKSKEQSMQILQSGFASLFAGLSRYKPGKLSLEEWVKEEFILFAVQYIRNIRSEYYVASTVRVTDAATKTYDLFVDNDLTDFKHLSFDVLVKSLHQLVPSQRLIFNLHIVDQYDLRRSAEMLEASEQTVKSNLEKARFNLQKNIDKNSKSQKNEQLV